MNIRRILSPVLSCLVCIWLSSTPVLACRCGANPFPKVALEKADAVFQGSVVEINPNRIVEGPGRSKRTVIKVVFRATAYWKGVNTASINLLFRMSSCSFRFRAGQEYIVYAYRGGPIANKKPWQRALTTHMCTRTAKVTEAKLDLEELGEGQTPVDEPKPDAA